MEQPIKDMFWNMTKIIGFAFLLAVAIGCLAFVSCANVSSTRFIYQSGDKTVMIEMPKEIEARNLSVTLNAETGTAEIYASYYTSTNVAAIKAQAEREAAVSESVTKGAAQGAVEGLMPLPYKLP